MNLFSPDPHAGWVPLLERVLLALWVGGWCAIGYLAVPVLFSQLAERAQAGALAGVMFSALNHFALAAGALLLMFAWWRRNSGAWPKWQVVTLIVMVLVVAGMQFGLQPVMAGLREEAAAQGGVLPARFGQLHGISSALYLVVTVLGLALLAAHGHRRR